MISEEEIYSCPCGENISVFEYMKYGALCSECFNETLETLDEIK